MPIPTYENLMKPVLEAIADNQAHHMKDVVEALANIFQLTSEERSQRLPSGGQTVFYSRVGWARTYLKKAGLLTSPRRGFIQITERGRKVLQENPDQINNKFLLRFDEFRSFREESRASYGGQEDSTSEPIEPAGSAKAPEERLESAFAELRASLISDILDRVKQLTPRSFERLVVDVLVKIGYGGANAETARVIGRSGDEGIDGIIQQDPLGLDMIYIQAKQWTGPVSRPEVQKFVGALQGQRVRKGVFITSSEFTKEAIEFIRNSGTNVVLIDGKRLAELMLTYGVGVSTARSYEVKRLDGDYFAELEEIAE